MTLNPDFHTMINKYAFAFAALACTQGANAQNWITLTDHVGNDVTNSTCNLFQLTSGGATLVIHLEAEISGSTSRTVNVKRYEMGVTAGTQNYFCWALCYLPQNAGQSPLWVSADDWNLSPGVPFSGFGGYHVHNGDYSLSTYRYVWYDVANPNDSAFVDLVFESAVGIAEGTVTQEFSINPNPANDLAVVALNRTSDGTDALAVYNALGAQVLRARISPAQRNAELNTSTLEEGLYFVSLERQGRTVGTQRLVLTR